MKKKIIYLLLIITSITLLICYAVIKYPYSKGMRTGTLVKLSKKGFIFKTYEGILDLGSGDQLTWQFSIRDKKIGEILLNKTGKVIQLKYVEHLYRLFFNTKYNVVAWKIMSKNGESTELLCRFVDVLRNNVNLVEKIRPLLLEYDPSLLEQVKSCQKN